MKIYYGSETKKALKNFPFTSYPTEMDFIFSIVKIKQAAAEANYKADRLSLEAKIAIISACKEILLGQHNSQFILSSFQGGAGTAINMNVNEVVANRATEILKSKKVIHANDEVNCSQSTNDVNPSALKISTYFLLGDLDLVLQSFIKTLESKAKEFKMVLKLGRTHLQDAIPTTMGREFEAYAFNLKKHQSEIKKAQELCLVLNLGGTAIGNSINASPIYLKQVYLELNKLTKVKFKPALNKMAKTSSQTDFLMVSQKLVSLCVELSKLANDFKFMSSGPQGGIGEISLPELQKGSSIMPGKINPIMPELMNQLYYLVSGNNITIEKAVEGSQMELGVMLPIISIKLFESLKMSLEVIDQFNKLCLMGIKVNKEKCLFHLENSTAYATLLVPKLGYDLVSKLVKESLSGNKKIKDLVIDGKYMSKEEFEGMVNSYLKVV